MMTAHIAYSRISSSRPVRKMQRPSFIFDDLGIRFPFRNCLIFYCSAAVTHHQDADSACQSLGCYLNMHAVNCVISSVARWQASHQS